MDFMDLKLSLWVIRKSFKKKNTHTHTHTQRREIHTCNSVDDRFDKAFYHGIHKHQIP